MLVQGIYWAFTSFPCVKPAGCYTWPRALPCQEGAGQQLAALEVETLQLTESSCYTKIVSACLSLRWQRQEGRGPAAGMLNIDSMQGFSVRSQICSNHL